MDESTQQAPNDTLKLAKLIRQKLNVLKQVRELTRLQSDAIDNSEMKRLMNVLTAKTRLLRDLEAMDSDLKPFHAQDPDQRVWSSPEARAQCRLDSEQCQSVILEVMHAEKQCESTQPTVQLKPEEPTRERRHTGPNLTSRATNEDLGPSADHSDDNCETNQKIAEKIWRPAKQ